MANHIYSLSVHHDHFASELWRRRIAESGIVDLEYSCGKFPPAADVRERLALLKPLIEAGSVRFPSLHLPFHWTNERPAQPEEFERHICVERLKFMIELFLPLGMQNLTMHPGSPLDGESREEGIRCVRKTIEEVYPTAAKHNLSLNIELCPRGSLSHVPEEMEALLDGMPDCVGICFDVNHADLRYAEVPEWIARLGKRIRSFHISDSDGIDECHWFPGVGALDWPAIMREINRLDHACPLIWEIGIGGYDVPGFIEREVDPVWFLRRVKESMAWLQSL